MTQLGKFDIIEEIGRGGFGIVYKARDLSLDRLVALKVLHPQLTVDTRFIENFKREARNLAKVEHPNMVNIYEINEVEGRLFIAMRYLPGGSLADRIAQGPLELEEALRILQQVGEGLNAGHKQGIIHRDVKPSNILFDSDGQAVVADFGVARAVHVSTIGTTSVSGGMVGTPYYRPPELWRGSPPPSLATDIYSLACVLYEMLTGDVLFSGETPDQVLTRHVLDEAGLLIEKGAKDLPQSVQAVLKKALSKAPEDRHQDLVSFLVNLQPPAKQPFLAQQVADETKQRSYPKEISVTTRQPEKIKHSIPKEVSPREEFHKPKQVKHSEPSHGKLPKWVPWGALILIITSILIGIVIVNLKSQGKPALEVLVDNQTEDEIMEFSLGTEENPLIWALVPSGNTQTILAGFDIVADIIYQETGLVIEPFVATEYAGVIAALSTNPPGAHIASLATFGYLVAAERGVAEAELVGVRHGASSYNGQIFVRSDSGITSVEDLVGKTFCRPDPLSTSGWIIPSITMQSYGIDPEDDLVVVTAGSHEASVAGVYNGDCDAGSSYVDARSGLDEDYADVMDVIQVIEVSADIPNDGVQYHPVVSRELRDAINAALVAMPETKAGAEALEMAYEWSELTPKGDDFYDPFRQVILTAGIKYESLLGD